MVKRDLVFKSSKKQAVKFKLYHYPDSGDYELTIDTPLGHVLYLYDDKDLIQKIAVGDEG
jgi:hypothetical protein